ncbi:hypothetical protein RmaAA213_19420 [Rhodothermus marinus]|nr:hypothetical protein RmaAA213_19420 [Rhodothermus marinus]BBM73082.1 hypothetical protein RmaAA338_19470 [Rhodothermus marinus]
MGISPHTVRFLREQGYDAVHLRELKGQLLTDASILELARTERRILLTHDLDFGELMAASGARLPTVIVFRLRNMRPENVNRYLMGIIDRFGDQLRAGAMVSVTEAQVRIRSLPLSS